MKKLSDGNRRNFEAAIKREWFDRASFDSANRKIRLGLSVRPDGVFLDREIPRTLTEWRKDPAWALEFVERHQAACDEAWRRYWVMMTSNAKLSRAHDELK